MRYDQNIEFFGKSYEIVNIYRWVGLADKVALIFFDLISDGIFFLPNFGAKIFKRTPVLLHMEWLYYETGLMEQIRKSNNDRIVIMLFWIWARSSWFFVEESIVDGIQLTFMT